MEHLYQVSPLSLKDIVMDKIIISLLTSRREIPELVYRYRNTNEWNIIEVTCQTNFMHLPLPNRVKCSKELKLPIKRIGVSIFAFLHFIGSISSDKDFLMYCLTKLCWTATGKVDLTRTARRLMQDEKVTLVQRYVIACSLCFEEDIGTLWNMTSSEDKETIHLYSVNMENDPLTYWYNRGLIKEPAEIEDFDEGCYMMFKCKPMFTTNVPTLNYFVRKQLDSLRDDFLKKLLEEIYTCYKEFHTMCEETEESTFYYVKHLDELVLCLLSQHHDEESETLWYDSLTIHRYFLKYMMQEPLMKYNEDILKHWPFNIRKDRPFMMKLFYHKVHNRFEEKEYRQFVMKNMWTRLASDPSSVHIPYPLLILFDTASYFNYDCEVWRDIMSETSPEYRESMIFRKSGILSCEIFASQKLWELLEFVIDLCVPEGKLQQFYEKFNTSYFHRNSMVAYCKYLHWWHKDAHLVIQEFLRTLMQTRKEKRPRNDVDYRNTKKFCSYIEES